MGRAIVADFPSACSANCGKTWQKGETFYWDKWNGPAPNDPTKTIEIKVKCSDQKCFEKQGGKLEASGSGPRQGKSIKTRIEQVTAMDATIFTVALQRAKQSLNLPLDAEGYIKHLENMPRAEKAKTIILVAQLTMEYSKALATGFSA